MHQQKETSGALLTATFPSLGLTKQKDVLSLKTLGVDVLQRRRLLFWQKELVMQLYFPGKSASVTGSPSMETHCSQALIFFLCTPDLPAAASSRRLSPTRKGLKVNETDLEGTENV